MRQRDGWAERVDSRDLDEGGGWGRSTVRSVMNHGELGSAAGRRGVGDAGGLGRIMRVESQPAPLSLTNHLRLDVGSSVDVCSARL